MGFIRKVGYAVEYCEKFGAEKYYTTVEAVDLCLPPSEHCPRRHTGHECRTP